MSEVLHFDEAINPYGCSPKVVKAMVEFAKSRKFKWYGEEPLGESLRAALAEHFGLAPDNFIVYNGVGEAVAWLYIVYLILKRGTIITPYPSYERFVDGARICTDKVIEIQLNMDDFTLPIERVIEEARQKRATLGLISNPNNPSGTLMADDKAMNRLVEELPGVLWIVDEAFADYAGMTFVPWVKEFPRLIVLRTFSKAYGLAGLRVGYLAANPAVIKEMAPFRIPWGVDSMALVAAEAALRDQAYLKEIVACILRDTDEFSGAIGKIPHFHPRKGLANFFLVRMEGIDPGRVKDHLAGHNVKVRSRPDMPDYIRVTSLTPDVNQKFLEILNGLQ